MNKLFAGLQVQSVRRLEMPSLLRILFLLPVSLSILYAQTARTDARLQMLLGKARANQIIFQSISENEKNKFLFDTVDKSCGFYCKEYY